MAYVIYSMPTMDVETYCFVTIAASEQEASAMCEGLNSHKDRLGAAYMYGYIDDPQGDVLEASNLIEWLHGENLIKAIRGE